MKAEASKQEKDEMVLDADECSVVPPRLELEVRGSETELSISVVGEDVVSLPQTDSVVFDGQYEVLMLRCQGGKAVTVVTVVTDHGSSGNSDGGLRTMKCSHVLTLKAKSPWLQSDVAFVCFRLSRQDKHLSIIHLNSTQSLFKLCIV